MKHKLLGSAPTIEALRTLISKYFYSEITLNPISKNEWHVHNSIKQIDGCRVLSKNGRFRFEMEISK